MIETIVIVALLVFIGYKEWRNELHVRDLEEKIISTNPNMYWAEKNKGKRPAPNEMMKPDVNEVMLADIPNMRIPKKFNIEMDGDAATPMEKAAAATKK